MKYLPSRNALLGVVGATAALSALAAVSIAQDNGSSATAPSPATIQPNTAAPGMMVAKDPVTGQLRAPTPEEMAALQSASAGSKAEGKSAPALRSQQLPNGAVVTTLDSSYDLFSVATKGADGKIQRACVPAAQLDAVINAGSIQKKKEVLDEK